MVGSRLCVLCGVNAATQGKGDHLPPQCLYPKPRVPNVTLNAVPACTGCNSTGGKDDEIFKVIIGFLTVECREESERLVDSLARTMGGNNRMAQEILERSRNVPLRGNDGRDKPMLALTFCTDAYKRVVARIVRGLYWQRTGRILGDATVSVAHGAELNHEAVEKIRSLAITDAPVVLNGGTFKYIASFAGNESFWELDFFGSHTAYAAVSSEPNAILLDQAPGT